VAEAQVLVRENQLGWVRATLRAVAVGQGQQGMKLLAGIVVWVFADESFGDLEDAAVPEDRMEGLGPGWGNERKVRSSQKREE
jgi:hypothetical protein